MEIPFKGMIRTNLVVLFYILGKYMKSQRITMRQQ